MLQIVIKAFRKETVEKRTNTLNLEDKHLNNLTLIDNPIKVAMLQ